MLGLSFPSGVPLIFGNWSANSTASPRWVGRSNLGRAFVRCRSVRIDGAPELDALRLTPADSARIDQENNSRSAMATDFADCARKVFDIELKPAQLNATASLIRSTKQAAETLKGAVVRSWCLAQYIRLIRA
ncbi:MAG: hypothetical protein U1E48_08755 [Paracoccaceae bacterium]